MLKYFWHKYSRTMEMKTDILVIIPLLLYVTRSVMTDSPYHQAKVYGIHVTPFITFAINWGEAK